MAHFEKKDFPEISYCIIDDYRREVQLTPEQAYELLQWLYDRRDDLLTPIHPVEEEAANPPTVRYVEIRLYQDDWQHLDALKAAIPQLQEEYEAPSQEERHGQVKVLRVRYDTLSQTAINLLSELQVETDFS